MKFELSDIQKAQQRKRRGHREGERVHLLAVISVTAPVFQLDTSWLNADANSNTAWREGATKKKKDQPKQQTRYTISNHKNKITKRVRSVIIRNSSCRLLFKNTTAEGVATERGRESALTAVHSCHRARFPFGHVLIERRCGLKHCKRECNKEKKAQQQTRYRFKIQNGTTECEHCGGHREGDSRRQRPLTVSHIYHRTRIPFWHVLIEHRCLNKHCKRRGCNNERSNQPTTKTTKRYRSKNKRIERLVR